jgi:heme-degrading monooxygenase HmoA
MMGPAEQSHNLWKACLASWLMVVAIVGFPNFAWADKPPTPFGFNKTDGAITAVSLYETTSATQKEAFKEAFKTSKSLYKAPPGFDSFAVLASSDGEQVVELTQWQDLTSYEAFQTSFTTTSEDYSKYYEKYTQTNSDAANSQPFLTGIFAIEHVTAPPGMVMAISGENALVQMSLFSATDMDTQQLVVAAVKRTFADLPQLYPAPRSAALLTGIDTPNVLLIATWGSVTEFADPSQVPELSVNLPTVESLLVGAPISDTLEANTMPEDAPMPVNSPENTEKLQIAAIDNHLFQVVKIIASKPEKS